MAKWGEGDPRWIVEEREDATNVNNWHWTEKNATGWSQKKLKSLLEGLKITNDLYSCEIKELTTVDGEASANNRKAKLIFFYEWDLKAEWSGEVLESAKVYKGKVEVPNLSEENEPEDLDIGFTVTDAKDDDAFKLKEFMRKEGEPKVRDQLAKYIQELKSEFSQGMILAKGKDSPQPQAQAKATNDAKSKLAQPVEGVPANKNIGVKIKCKILNDKQKFQCSAGDLYRALTDKDASDQMVKAYTRSDVQMSVEKGGRFRLFDDNITGDYQCLEFNKQIVMRWRFKTWPEEHYSTVTLDISESDNGTQLSLSQTGIPESEFERTKQGWVNYYWDAIRQTFGFGARLY
uniref:Activator of Hsp90 ATPase AHSA1-like N-terminal domain-containing protein n=1 Tax=Capitella teleta TaxID=283909 RepID=X1Z9S8_CAPTE